MYQLTVGEEVIEYRLPLRAQYRKWRAILEKAVMPNGKTEGLYDASKYLAQTCCVNKTADELDAIENECFDLYDIMSEAIEKARAEVQKKLKTE